MPAAAVAVVKIPTADAPVMKEKPVTPIYTMEMVIDPVTGEQVSRAELAKREQERKPVAKSDLYIK